MMTKVNIIDNQDNGGIYIIFSAFVSNSNPVANNPFRNREGASRRDPIVLVNSLNVNSPKLASSINHFIKIVIFFAIGNLSISGNSLDQVIRFGKKYKINEINKAIKIILFLK